MDAAEDEESRGDAPDHGRWHYHAIEMPVRLPDGKGMTIDARLYEYRDGVLTIEIRQFIMALRSSRKKFKWGKELRSAKDCLHEICTLLGFRLASLVFASKRQLKFEKKLPGEYNRSCQTVTMEFLLLFFAMSVNDSSKREIRVLAFCILQAFLERLAPANLLQDIDAAECLRHGSALCDESEGHGCCPHLQPLEREIAEMGPGSEYCNMGYSSSTHTRWTHKDAATYQFCTNRHFHGLKGVFGTYEDASKIGKPAKEMILYIAKHVGTGRGAAMIPQVLRGNVTELQSLHTAAARCVQPVWNGKVPMDKYGKMSTEGLDAYAGKVESFLSVKVEEETAVRRSVATPRLPNFYNAIGFDQTFRLSFGFGIDRFLPARRLQPLQVGQERVFAELERLPASIQRSSGDRTCRSFIKGTDGKTVLEALWGGERSAVHCNLDCGSIGWPSKNALFYSPHSIRGERWVDPPHRRANNITDGLTAASLTSFRAEAVVIENCEAGPYEGAAHGERAAEFARELTDSLEHDDELFLYYYPWISHCAARGQIPCTYGTPEHVAEMWEHVKQANGNVPEVEITKMNRRFQVWKKIRPWFRKWGAKAYMGTAQCLSQGFFTSRTEVDVYNVAPLVETHIGEAAAAAAAPATRSVKGSSGKLDRLRTKCKNAFELRTRILNNMTTRGMLVGLSTIIEPLERRHYEDVQDLKSDETRLELNVCAAAGTEDQYIIETMSFMDDPSVHYDMGTNIFRAVCVSTVLPPPVANEVMKSLYHFWREMVAMEILFRRKHSKQLPGKSFALLHKDEEKRREALEFMKKLWTRLAEAEQLAHDDNDVDAHLDAMECGRNVWVRELLLGAAECKFEKMPSDLLKEIRQTGAVVGSSVIIELLFNEQRRQVEKNGRQGPSWALMNCVNASEMVDFDMGPVDTDDTDEIASGTQLPSSCFTAKSGIDDFSLGRDMKASILGDPLDHPSLSIKNHLKSSVATQALMDVPTVQDVKTIWMSLLLLEGSIIQYADVWKNYKGYVLKVFAEGALIWRGEEKEVNGLKFFTFEKTGTPWDAISVCKSRIMNFEMKEVEPRAPVIFHDDVWDPVLRRGSSLQYVETAHPALLPNAASKAFPNFTVEQLKLLYDDQGIEHEGRKPTLMIDLLRALMFHVLPALTEEEFVAAVKTRKQQPKRWDSAIDDNEDLVDEVIGDEEVDKVAGDVDKGKPKPPDPKPKKSGASSSAAPPIAGDGAGSSAGPSGGAGEPAAPPPLPPPPGPPPGHRWYTKQEAQALCPDVRGVTISIIDHNRWQVKYPDREIYPRSHSRRWNGAATEEEMAKLHREILIECLEWAWTVHNIELMRLPPCPHDFSLI